MPNQCFVTDGRVCLERYLSIEITSHATAWDKGNWGSLQLEWSVTRRRETETHGFFPRQRNIGYLLEWFKRKILTCWRWLKAHTVPELNIQGKSTLWIKRRRAEEFAAWSVQILWERVGVGKGKRIMTATRTRGNCKGWEVKRTMHYIRARTGHGKPGKSWNSWFQFPGLESHGILVKVMESHGKVICFRKIKRQKDKKFEKITGESKTGFNFSRNKNKHVFYAL